MQSIHMNIELYQTTAARPAVPHAMGAPTVPQVDEICPKAACVTSEARKGYNLSGVMLDDCQGCRRVESGRESKQMQMTRC